MRRRRSPAPRVLTPRRRPDVRARPAGVSGRTLTRGVLTLLLGLAACRGGEDVDVASPELLGLRADQVMVGLEHFMTREGVRRAHLLADTARFFPDESRIQLRGLRITFFNAGGEPQSTLRAREGVYDTETTDMEASGDVVVVNESAGRRLETARIAYDVEDDVLRGDTTFVFRRGESTTRGSSFVSDPSMDRVRLSRPQVVTPGVEVPQ
ncbi:MAG: LPS export ABC transporter periplasmic protein LptC [Gemmatimonadota bacterium]